MGRATIIRNIVIDGWTAAIIVTAIIICYGSPFLFGRKSIIIVIAKCSRSIPAYVGNRVMLKADIDTEYAATVVYPCCSTIGGSIVALTQAITIIIKIDEAGVLAMVENR